MSVVKSTACHHYLSTEQVWNSLPGIARFMPLGAGFVDIFIGQFHVESDEQIE